MIQADLRSLFSISENSVFVSYDGICPTVFFQAMPNLILLLHCHSVRIILVTSKEPKILNQGPISIWNDNC